ncbi:MAG TPA: phage tail sheath subtilisin-like domain-containing protein [Motilibacterales bacterium]|nr:phage tail sheath subtilisin-like domain-containing protein [Motilibacterales bacterium]
MPEYLTPGVYLEETSFRSKSIEGVPTSTFGMAGLTRYGPVAYQLAAPKVTMVDKPLLVTSFTEFERAFGGLEDVGTGLDDARNYLAYAARAFFDNGGRRLYVSRVFPFALVDAGLATERIDLDANFAKLHLNGSAAPPVGTPALAVWRARWPGEAGQAISVQVAFRRSKNLLQTPSGGGAPVLRGVTPGAAVEIFDDPDPTKLPKDTPPTKPVTANLRTVAAGAGNTRALLKDDGTTEPLPAGKALCHITLDVTVRQGDIRFDTYTGLELGANHARAVCEVLRAEQPTDPLSVVWLDLARPDVGGNPTPAATPSELLDALLELDELTFLTGGGEGRALTPEDLKGARSDPDDPEKAATGLAALGEIDDIAIVAMPDAIRFGSDTEWKTATDTLIGHAEELRYRIAIVDPPRDRSISGVREFRSQFDTKYGALYYPWVEILDPTAVNDPGAAPATLQLPPSGLTAGIYARSDIQRGVHKAPANEVILGITRFMQNVTFDRQSVLNPEGINALRYFPGRSNRIWGARTMSSDPEWKYVNVRRLFIYLEHSIDKSTQWAVFEPNNEALWANIRQTIADFLLVTWKTGALMGTKPEDAFFVRCDRTTMTQNDLDNGRLICLIGVAPTYPAEFVIFRIGQWTADARQS